MKINWENIKFSDFQYLKWFDAVVDGDKKQVILTPKPMLEIIIEEM